VRNPWGSERGEWKGDWSDGSSLWKELTDEVKEKMKVQKKGDGEFWMTMTDFIAHFNDIHICNFTPDFDEDGKEDNLSTTRFMLWCHYSSS
jgi:hypothetical protein